MPGQQESEQHDIVLSQIRNVERRLDTLGDKLDNVRQLVTEQNSKLGERLTRLEVWREEHERQRDRFHTGEFPVIQGEIKELQKARWTWGGAILAISTVGSILVTVLMRYLIR